MSLGLLSYLPVLRPLTPPPTFPETLCFKSRFRCPERNPLSSSRFARGTLAKLSESLFNACPWLTTLFLRVLGLDNSRSVPVSNQCGLTSDVEPQKNHWMTCWPLGGGCCGCVMLTTASAFRIFVPPPPSLRHWEISKCRTTHRTKTRTPPHRKT